MIPDDECPYDLEPECTCVQMDVDRTDATWCQWHNGDSTWSRKCRQWDSEQETKREKGWIDRGPAGKVVGKTYVETIQSYYERQIEWSRRTFGEGKRTKGILNHIRKELSEIEADPTDLTEWLDVMILAMDGYWRHGGTAETLLPGLLAKQAANFARSWPAPTSEDEPVEHIRSET